VVSFTTLGDICIALALVEMKVAKTHTAQGSIDGGKRVQVFIGLIFVFVFGKKQDCLHSEEIIRVTREGVLLGLSNDMLVLGAAISISVMVFDWNSETAYAGACTC